MNFLEICQKANTLASLQGTLSTVAGTSGYQVNLVKYVQDAWIDLQLLRDWPFMRKSLSFSTVSGTNEYSLTTIFGAGVTQDLRKWLYLQYTNSNGDYKTLRKISYDRWLQRDRNEDSSSAPEKWAEDPVDRHVYLNTPDNAYTITGHYITQPVKLVNNGDIPKLPLSYHLLIAYLGAMKMASHMGNANIYNELQKDSDYMLGSLMRDRNPGQRVELRGIA